jgi:tyrosinase
MRTGITIDGANYIAWAPVRSSIRLVEADGGANFVDVLLRNQSPGEGGQIVFRDAIPGTEQDSLRLRLPGDGTPVDFFIAGKFSRPSEADKDAVIEAVEANTGAVLSTTPLMVRIRKDANDLTAEERNRFLSALAILNDSGMGRFSDFRNMHTQAASPEAHGNAGFLPWHRVYILDLERELQRIDPSVALPYWRFDEPAPNLFTSAFIGVPNEAGRVQFDPGNPLEYWWTDLAPGINRRPRFDTNTSPASVISEAITLLLGGSGHLYANFLDMEIDPHGSAHTSFRLSISSISTAAKDPLFFLLHANVDRLWAKWQWLRRRFDAADPATYPFLGSASDPGATRVGHNLKDTMWPWNQATNPPRPVTAPGGTLANSPTATAPGPTPTVGDTIDYQGVISPGSHQGFGYDDVPFEF